MPKSAGNPPAPQLWALPHIFPSATAVLRQTDRPGSTPAGTRGRCQLQRRDLLCLVPQLVRPVDCGQRHPWGPVRGLWDCRPAPQATALTLPSPPPRRPPRGFHPDLIREAWWSRCRPSRGFPRVGLGPKEIVGICSFLDPASKLKQVPWKTEIQLKRDALCKTKIHFMKWACLLGSPCPEILDGACLKPMTLVTRYSQLPSCPPDCTGGSPACWATLRHEK